MKEEQQERKLNKMATMPVGRLLASMAMPAIIAMLIQALYNIVDSIFVSRVSAEAFLSVSLAFPLQMLLIAVAVGSGVGLNSLIARRLGEGNPEEAGRAATHGILLAVCSWVIFLLIAIFATKPYFEAFTQNAEVFQAGSDYVHIVLGLSVFGLVSLSVEKMIQATGNMMMPMLQDAAGAIVNVVLDPILIFGWFGLPKMGVAGAATATVIGQAVSMTIGLFVMFRKKHDFQVQFKGFRFSKSMVVQIYQVGLPAIIMQAIVSIMLTGMNAILTPLSATAVSVLSGVYFKVQSFIFMPVFGLTQGAMPIMGYNYGARNKDRLMQTYKITFIAAFCIMLIGTILFWTCHNQILAMFQATPEMYEIGVPALHIISLSFVGAAFGIVNSVMFQAVGYGLASLIVSAVRQLVAILPAAWLLAHFVGLGAVWYAFLIAEIFAFLVSTVFLLRIYRSKIVPLAQPHSKAG